MSDTSVDQTKTCYHCEEQFQTRHIADYADVLRHFLREHPQSERLIDVVRGVFVEVDCQSCGETFAAELRTGNGRLAADAHCPTCHDEDPVRELFAQELRATEAIKRAMDDEFHPHSCADAPQPAARDTDANQ